MKTSSAVIRLVLWESKTLKDGTNPIMLAIRFNGQSLISTHVSCKPTQWDKRNQCLKRSFPNASALNAMLADMLNRAIKIKIKLEQDGVQYAHKTIADLFKGGEVDKSKPSTFIDIMHDMFVKRSLAPSSQSAYNNAYLSISRFLNNPNFIPSDINDDVIKSWAAHCSSVCCSNTMLGYIQKISTTLAYAAKIGVSFKMPLEGIDYIHSHYRLKTEHRNLDAQDILKLEMHYESTYAVNDGLLQRTSKQFVLAFFLCSYHMQGLAPIDLLQLKTENITETNVNGLDCYKINTRRQKTRVPLTIIVPKIKLVAEILRFLLESASTRGGYVFPVFYSNCNKDKLSRTFNTTANRHLASIASELGIKPFTLYAARHSFATIKIREGANIGLLANAMGRSINNIGTYISNLSSDDDLFKLSIM